VSRQLPDPRLTQTYRLEATLALPLDLGDSAQGHRRVVPRRLADHPAEWHRGGDIRYILQTDRGDLLYARSHSSRHGSPEVLARLGRGEDVDPGEYTFRTSTEIETAAPDLDWLNNGIFISVGGRQAAGVIYETYLIG
jgi:Protein of unknown function (DUF3237)